MRRIFCEFCGKPFAKGDNVVSIVATQPNTHHHLKCVIDAAITEATRDLRTVVEDMLSGLRYLRQVGVPYGFGIDRLEQSANAALERLNEATKPKGQ